MHMLKSLKTCISTGLVDFLAVRRRHDHLAVLDQHALEQPRLLQRHPIELLKVQPTVVVGVVHLQNVARNALWQAVALMPPDQALHLADVQEAVPIAIELESALEEVDQIGYSNRIRLLRVAYLIEDLPDATTISSLLARVKSIEWNLLVLLEPDHFDVLVHRRLLLLLMMMLLIVGIDVPLLAIVIVLLLLILIVRMMLVLLVSHCDESLWLKWVRV